MSNAKAYFFKFDVKLRCWCPECGEPNTPSLSEWDVHALLEGLLDVECAECGAKFRAVMDDD